MTPNAMIAANPAHRIRVRRRGGRQRAIPPTAIRLLPHNRRLTDDRVEVDTRLSSIIPDSPPVFMRWFGSRNSQNAKRRDIV